LQSLICTTDKRMRTNLFCDWHHISKNFFLAVFSSFSLSCFCRPVVGEESLDLFKFSYYLSPQEKIPLSLIWNLCSLVILESNMYKIMYVYYRLDCDLSEHNYVTYCSTKILPCSMFIIPYSHCQKFGLCYDICWWILELRNTHLIYNH
jgi:hypothetical protein